MSARLSVSRDRNVEPARSGPEPTLLAEARIRSAYHGGFELRLTKMIELAYLRLRTRFRPLMAAGPQSVVGLEVLEVLRPPTIVGSRAAQS